ncbi:MAG: ferredoxin:glutaredoxin reductase, partial [Candidatus Bathyarchaeota archaeon]
MVRTRALSDAEAYGYHLNPDKGFLDDLIEGLARNEERFGYPSCPCRLASG